MGGLGLAQDYKAAVTNSNNDTLQIDGHSFERINDLLVTRAPAAAQIASVFPTRQDYWDYINFDPTEVIDRDGFEQGLTALEKSFHIQYQSFDDSSTLMKNEDAIAIEKAHLVFEASGKSLGLFLADGGGGDGGAGSAGFAVTGRVSMAKDAQVQCYQFGQPEGQTEKIGGRWIAGVDGGTLGTKSDSSGPAGEGPKCGQTFSITNNQTGDTEQYVVADRVWQNDGAGGCTWGDNQKADADAKINCQGSGKAQIDVANGAYEKQFGKANPAEGTYTINGL